MAEHPVDILPFAIPAGQTYPTTTVIAEPVGELRSGFHTPSPIVIHYGIYSVSQRPVGGLQRPNTIAIIAGKISGIKPEFRITPCVALRQPVGPAQAFACARLLAETAPPPTGHSREGYQNPKNPVEFGDFSERVTWEIVFTGELDVATRWGLGYVCVCRVMLLVL